MENLYIMMGNFVFHIVSVTVLLFLLITFLQSSIDKAIDWKGNISWLKNHFSNTFLANIIPYLLTILLIIEIITSLVCVVGVYFLIIDNDTYFATWGMFFGCFTLLLLLFGQRVAKDYPGALTITCYFMVAVFGLYVITSHTV